MGMEWGAWRRVLVCWWVRAVQDRAAVLRTLLAPPFDAIHPGLELRHLVAHARLDFSDERGAHVLPVLFRVPDYSELNLELVPGRRGHL